MRPSKVKWIKQINAQRLSLMLVVSLMLPVLVLVYTEQNSFWTSVACVLLPLGGYTLFASLSRHSGLMVWLSFPLLLLSSFQIVLSYLFGNSVVSADMFLNVLTTNSAEAGELLTNIYPAFIIVILIYVPLLWLAAVHIRHREILPAGTRLGMVVMAVVAFLFGCLALVGGCRGEIKHVIRDEIFPVNVAVVCVMLSTLMVIGTSCVVNSCILYIISEH